MVRLVRSRWLPFSLALTGAVVAGGAGLLAWQQRPQARIQAVVAVSNQAAQQSRWTAAWSQLQALRPLHKAAADYYQARLLVKAPELSPDGQAGVRAAQMLRAVTGDPVYGDRARLALAELLTAHPDLARSPDEAGVNIQAAALNGNKRANLILAEQLTKRPDADKLDILRRLVKSSESNARASDELLALLENRTLPAKSEYLIQDIRSRRFTNLLRETKEGDVEAMVKVGDAYRDGRGVAGNLKAASQWYSRAVALNSNSARLRQIDLLRQQGTPASVIQAHKLAMEAAAQSRTPGAFTELGRDFKLGRGTPVDRAKAEFYFRKAAATGFAPAQYELADTLLDRQSPTAPADPEALNLLTLSARSGNDGAAWLLYNLYNKGQHGVTPDRPLAVTYLVQAANSGRSGARAELAKRYSQGDDIVARNEGEAFHWASGALEAGASSTSLSLIMADAYATGEVVAQDRLRAKAFLEAAVRQGDAHAMRKLGALYFTLQEPDAPQNAVRWLREAALRGETDAYVDLGRAYASGAGVGIDPARAFTFFQQADQAGNLSGTVEMARSFATGFGVAQNPVQAASLYRRAAGLGSTEAMILLSYCYETGEGVPKSLPDARVWLQKGAEAGDPEAEYWFGMYLLEGRGGSANRGEAIAYFQKSKDRKFKPAAAMLNQLMPAPKPVPPKAMPAKPQMPEQSLPPPAIIAVTAIKATS
ncbi:MAG: tetratricopeptide repeat protein [Asticcacaulis sp.]|uniref:tetratricopeptide repeat protein n=1 Tax=Asticcacaulis sp. TaxID=1872648 RepID=UPI0039E71561